MQTSSGAAMQIIECAKKRYATKAFDASKTIPADTLQAVKDLLRLSPSSVNSQPWHFIMAETAAGKARLAKATEGPFAYNKSKVLDASHVVIFCARTDLDEAFLQKITDQEGRDGRFKSEAAKADQHAKRAMYVNMHKDLFKDLPAWTTKQVYLNVGAFLLGVAALGLDAVPIEGFDAAVLDREFDLSSKGLTSVVIVAVGYHANNDANAALQKSRLLLDDILTVI